MTGNQSEMLFGLGIGIVMGVAAGFAIYRAGKPYIQDTPTPSCPKCHYPVKGISSLNCPECGVDFREVGIVPRKPVSRRLLIQSVLIAAIISTVCGFVLSGAFSAYL